MSEKQKRFADEYIICANATEAAKRAGYSEKTAGIIGYENLKKPYIKAYIDERLKELEAKRVATQTEVLQYLSSVMRGETKEETLAFQGEGVQEIKKIEVSSKDRIKAAELLGKRFGTWINKQQVEHSGQVNFVDDLSESSD